MGQIHPIKWNEEEAGRGAVRGEGRGKERGPGKGRSFDKMMGLTSLPLFWL